MKTKKTVIIIAVTVAVLICAIGIMALIGRNGAGSSVNAATQYIEASMRYDARGMASVASEEVRQTLYNTGEIPTKQQLIDALNKSYSGVPTGYEGKNITFTVVDSYENGNVGYVKLNVYVDGQKSFTRSCATLKVGGRWYYNGEPEA